MIPSKQFPAYLQIEANFKKHLVPNLPYSKLSHLSLMNESAFVRDKVCFCIAKVTKNRRLKGFWGWQGEIFPQTKLKMGELLRTRRAVIRDSVPRTSELVEEKPLSSWHSSQGHIHLILFFTLRQLHAVLLSRAKCRN